MGRICTLWAVREGNTIVSAQVTFPGCSALWNTLIKSEQFPVRKLASLTSFAAQECGPGPNHQAVRQNSLKDEVGKTQLLFLRRFARCRRNVPDSDFAGVSGLEAEFLEGRPYFCRLFLEAVVLLSSDGGHCDGFSLLPLVCLGVIPGCALLTAGLCGLPGASVGNIMLRKALSRSQWTLWFVINPD